MATPSETRVNLPPSFSYLIRKIHEHVTEIEQLRVSVNLCETNVIWEIIKLEFAGIVSCCNIAESVLEKERYYDRSDD